VKLPGILIFTHEEIKGVTSIPISFGLGWLEDSAERSPAPDESEEPDDEPECLALACLSEEIDGEELPASEDPLSSELIWSPEEIAENVPIPETRSIAPNRTTPSII
jgi:hypothetical protein